VANPSLTRKLARLEENLAAADLELTAADLELAAADLNDVGTASAAITVPGGRPLPRGQRRALR